MPILSNPIPVLESPYDTGGDLLGLFAEGDASDATLVKAEEEDSELGDESEPGSDAVGGTTGAV